MVSCVGVAPTVMTKEKGGEQNSLHAHQLLTCVSLRKIG